MSDTAFYDTVWSGGWDDMRHYGPMARHCRRLVLAMTNDVRAASILDVGCGEGSLLRALADAHPGATAAGIEVTDNAVALARRNLPGGTFAIADITQGRLDLSFDLVVCADVVEHLVEDDAALRNMAAMTNPGGCVLVATLQGRMRPFEVGVGHVRNYAPGELEAKMTRAGLRIERVLEWGFPFYSPLYRNFLEFLGNRGTTGRFGLGRKLLCHVLYGIFLLNSARRGDYIFVRARKPT